MSARYGKRPCRVATLAVAMTIGCMAPPLLAATSDAGADASNPDRSPATASRFIYKADGKRLSDVLNDFAASQGFPVVVDGRVEGVVSGNFDATPREFLDAMGKAYALLWYFDGTAFYFYPASSIQSRIFRLKGYKREQVVKLLESLHLSSQRYPIRWDSTNSTLLVYGPPRHVELVGLAIESLDIGAIEGNHRIARIFPLRNASAGDRQLGDVSVPGVVSTLRGVYGGGGKGVDPGTALAQAQKGAMQTTEPLRKGVAALYGSLESSQSKFGLDTKPNGAGGGSAITDDKSGATPGPRAVRSPLEDDDESDSPVFQADDSTNSVIVYCKARRMEEFAALIRSLDVLPPLVELEATIIDVSTDSLSSLGVDWSGQNVAGSGVSMTGPVAGAADAAQSGIPVSPFTITTLIADAGRSLMARVQALAADGRARIVSKPRVLGMANRSATMGDKRIVNVRVAGNLDVNLFQVEAGTTLQITPQVNPASGGNLPQIKLSIYIQDGSFEAQTVDQVPVVKKTEIRTEARVSEGESLLIGGISVDSDASGVTGVPWLKDVPVLGAAFRQKSHRSSRTERMFLLTPRIVSTQPRPAQVLAQEPLRPNTKAVLAPQLAASASTPRSIDSAIPAVSPVPGSNAATSRPGPPRETFVPTARQSPGLQAAVPVEPTISADAPPPATATATDIAKPSAAPEPKDVATPSPRPLPAAMPQATAGGPDPISRHDDKAISRLLSRLFENDWDSGVSDVADQPPKVRKP